MAAGARQLVAQNRRARHNYLIEDTLEAGLMLTGSEVKSLRLSRCSARPAGSATSQSVRASCFCTSESATA